MSKKTEKGHRKSLLTGASLLAAAAAAMSASPAFAQDAEEEEAIVVTGSRIPQPNLTGTSPVTQVTGEDIQQAGVTRVEDLTNELPQVFAAQGSNVSNGATGTAQVNLRGLGAQRTLVLVNGRRLGYGSPNSAPSDLNQIPGSMVERVEVLTGGASAVYGSDAIGGVVNFIMRDNFEGFQVDAQYGFYQHGNDFDDGYLREVIAARGVTNPSQFQLPEDNVIDGYGKEVTLTFGVSSPDDRGNVTGYFSYRNNDAVLQSNRDFSACSLSGPPSARQSNAAVTGVPAGAQHFLCGGSSTSFPGRFTNFGAISQTIDQTTGLFVPFSAALNQYNFGPLNYFQRPDERYSFGAFARYEINDSMEAYAQAMFMDYRSVAQIAPSGVFFGATVNCANPLLPANRAAIGCTPADVIANNPAPIYIGRRNVEGGGRQDDLNYESYRVVTGLRGDLDDNWQYDISGSYSRVNLSRTYLNDFSLTRSARALNVVDPDGAGPLGPTCQSVIDGTDPNCVPWNIFTPGGVTPAALAYLQIPLLQRGETIQQNVIATVAGDTGLGTPWAESNIATAFGVEYRRDILNSVVDTNFSSGDGAGQGGPTTGLSGETDVFELFGEARIPLVEDAPLADTLSLELAYRYSRYDNGETTDTYKVAGEWAPLEDLRFRASFQRAVRAPNIIELFSAQSVGLFNGTDPCHDSDGAGPITVPAACFVNVNPLAQVTIGQSQGGGLASPAGQYNQFAGGNPLLSPETSDTTTIGLVWQPSFLPSFSLSVDYFDITIENLVSTVGAQNTLVDCYATNNATSCGRISRNPGNGTLWTGIGQVLNLNENIGGLSTTGYDVSVGYSMGIGSMGELGLNYVATYLTELITDSGVATIPIYDCVGFHAGDASCGTPNPEYRHRLQLSWETPWDINANLTWRYYGEVQREGGFAVPVAGGLLDSEMPAENYFDISGNWQAMENTRFRFGVNNVLDNDPSISFSAANGNTYPQVYDALGRWVFMGVTVDF